MSDCQDMTTALARELTQGIEGEVEDLGAVFKRMALLKPAADVIEGTVVEDTVSDAETIAATKPTSPFAEPGLQVTKERKRPRPPMQTTGLLSMLHKPKPQRKKKSAPILENQMSLFDLLDETA